MKYNHLLKFQDFKKGTPVQDPKKEALVSGGEDTLKKETFVDQVKSSNLSQELDVNLPDYTKTKKMDEAADVKALANDINSLSSQKEALVMRLQQIKQQEADVIAQLGKIDSQTANKTADMNAAIGSSIAAGTSGAAASAQPAQPAQQTAPAAPASPAAQQAAK